jgi:hypothetical protein
MFRSKAGLADQRLCYANDSVRYENVVRAMVTKVKRGTVMSETSEQKSNRSPSTSGCATRAKVGNKSQRQHKFANAEAVFESCISLANDKSWPPHLSRCGVHAEQHKCAIDKFEVEKIIVFGF